MEKVIIIGEEKEAHTYYVTGSEYLKTFELNHNIIDTNLLAGIPNFQKISKAKKALLKPSVTPEYKADRNALCPCGSGKKFKKCCINKTISK